MNIKNGFPVFSRLCLIAGLVVVGQTFSMSFLTAGASCLAVPAKLLLACAVNYPAVTVVGLGVAGYTLYNNEHTAPYVRPVVNGGINLVGKGIEKAQHFCYIRPLENALTSVRGSISNLTRRAQELMMHNNAMQEQVNVAQQQAVELNNSVLRNQDIVQRCAQGTSNQTLYVGAALNGIARAVSSVGSTAQSAYSLLASLSGKFHGQLDTDLQRSFHYGDNEPTLVQALAVADGLANVTL